MACVLQWTACITDSAKRFAITLLGSFTPSKSGRKDGRVQEDEKKLKCATVLGWMGLAVGKVNTESTATTDLVLPHQWGPNLSTLPEGFVLVLSTQPPLGR